MIGKSGKRIIFGLNASVFLLIFSLFQVGSALAQGGPTVLLPGADTVQRSQIDAGNKAAQATKEAKDQLEKKTNEAIKDIWAVAFKNGVSRFLNKLAAETATYIASGGKGQKPLLFTSQWGDYLKDAGNSAAGDFISAISSEIGINICAPPSLVLNFGLSIKGGYSATEPACKFTDLLKNWDVTQPDFLSKYGAKFSPGQNDLGIALGLNILADEKSRAAKFTAELDRINQTVKNVPNAVSGVIETPGSLIFNELLKTADANKDEVQIFTGRIAADTINTFVSTLASQYLQRLQGGFFKASDLVSYKNKNLTSLFGMGGAAGGKSLASNIYNNGSKQLLTRTINDYNVVSELSTCLNDSILSGQNNCALDSGFVEALTASGENAYLTVREAVSKGYLHSNWPFGYKNPTGGVEPDVNEGYSYTNMVKLRRARILPLGWELAAKKIREMSNVFTLQQVMDVFDDPGTVGSPNPFYHLVDPDWVLKAPKYMCRASVPGQVLQVGTSNRKEYCADLKDCVVENSDGNGCAVWGYCTREKNIWRFASNSCQSSFSSCRTLTRSSDDAQFNLLVNTLDKGTCNSGNAGCMWYSQSKSADGSWIDQNRVYLNRTAAKCDPADEGCRQFLSLSNIKNNQSVEDVVRTVLADATKSDAYTNYADVSSIFLNSQRVSCTIDEVGCQNFKPVNNDPEINGVVGPTDYCPSECAGYNSFSQQATYLESGKTAIQDPSLNFIATTARSCAAEDVGCDQFTNLDQVQAGGETVENYSYIRQCQRPAQDCATYYTWEGSDESGFQLRSFNLKSGNPNGVTGPTNAQTPPINSSSINSTGIDAPKTVDNSFDCSDRNSPDCKKFYDANGNIYFREYKKTFSCSDRCFRYRLANGNQADCTNYGGTWDGAQCIYNAIPEQGVKCSAAAVACREYRGNTGENIAKPVDVSFENGSTGGFVGGILSSEAISAPGHSLKFDNKISLDVSRLVRKDKTYILDFSLKVPTIGTNTIRAVLGRDVSLADRSADLLIGSQTIINDRDWNSYSFGPLFFNRDANSDERLIISTSAQVYIDNIVLKEVQGRFFVVKNSWRTPLSCDTNPPLAGGTGISSALGCKQYTDKNGQPLSLKSVSRLCSAEKVGCQAVIDTQNYDSPYAKTFNTGDRSEITVPADKVTYVVNDPAKYCQATKKACMALGLPTLDPNGIAISFSTVHLINDPEKYDTILCKDEQLFCQEYQTSDGIVYYREPGNKVCEFRAVPNTTPVEYAWFKKGDSSIPNPAECGGKVPTGQTAPSNWAKSCPADQSGCTEFYEPVTRTSNYVIKDERLDTSSCNGVVDWKQGCVLFNDKSNSSLTFTAYDSNNAINTSLIKGVPPINCNVNNSKCDTNTLVKVQRDRSCGEWLSCQSSALFYDAQRNETRPVCYGVGRCVRAKESNPTECAEWLQDPYKACVGGPNDKRTCQRDTDCGFNTTTNKYYSCDASILTEEIYKGRDVTYSGQDFSGLSVPGLYPVEKYKQVVYGKDANNQPIFGLTYLEPVYVQSGQTRNQKTCLSALNSECGVGQLCINKLCYLDKGVDGTNRAGFNKYCQAPVLDSSGNRKGCYADADCGNDAGGKPYRCQLDPITTPGTEFKQCRGYPEAGSPFPSAVATFDADGNINHKNNGFTNANVGQPGEDVECSYQKATYLNGAVRYYAENNRDIPITIKQNQSGQSNNYGLVRDDLFTGWRGYCLEKDYSKVINGNPSENGCITWYPIDLVSGEVDFYNNSPSAGYNLALGSNYYCSESKLMVWRGTYNGPVTSTIGVAQGVCEGQTNYLYAAVHHGNGSSTGWYCQPRERDGTLRDGWYQFPGLFYGAESAQKLRQVCTKIVRIDDNGKTKPWTSRLMTPVGSTGNYVNDLSFDRNQDKLPFGAIEPPALSSPESWAQYENIADWNGDADGDSYKISQKSPLWVVPTSELINQPGNACPGNQSCDNGKCGGTGAACKSLISTCDNGGTCDAFHGICVGGSNDSKPCVANGVIARAGGPESVSFMGQIQGDNYVLPTSGTTTPAKGLFQIRNSVGNIPYSATEQVASGYARLKNLFAKVYGVWNWNLGHNVCASKCVGQGATAGAFCLSSADCGPVNTCDSQNITCTDGASSCSGLNLQDACGAKYDNGYKPVLYSGTNSSTNGNGWDITSQGQGVTIRQVKYDADKKSYFEGPKGFSLNRVSEQDLKFTEGVGVVSMQFYAYNSNGEQMPLRELEINWMDGGQGDVFSVGSFKNHKNICKQQNQKLCQEGSNHGQTCGQNADCPGGACQAYNWGDSDDACIQDTPTSQGYFTFVHIYNCQPGGFGWNNAAGQCEYQPRVRVRDNWGHEINETNGLCGDNDDKTKCSWHYNGNVFVKP